MFSTLVLLELREESIDIYFCLERTWPRIETEEKERVIKCGREVIFVSPSTLAEEETFREGFLYGQTA